MADVKITDLVPQETIDQVKRLDSEINKLYDDYAKTAMDMAKGLELKVKVIGDIDKLQNLHIEKTTQAAEIAKKINAAMAEQQQVLANTTNTIQRHLAEQERSNKAQREAYTDTEKFKALLEKVNGSYQDRIRRSVQLDDELKEAKARESALNAEYKKGLIDKDRYVEVMTELRAETRALKQEQSDLNLHLKNEEREANSVENSYRNLSQRLELMRKAYRDMTDEEKEKPLGKEVEAAIQSLNAHLIDWDADMGVHQRNVGNYAIANSGLKKNYEELIGALAELQAQYGKMSEAEKASEEGQKLAQSINEVSSSARDTKQALEEHNQALEEARRSLGETGGKTSSVKRDLKELVLEIANLTIEYQSLSEEEQASADGQALADHIHDLTEKAGVLKDAIADTNQAISNAASDTRGLDQVGGALQLAIDGFGLATGAAEMLGISSEDLASIQTKLQAAIAASNAMQSIQNTLQAQSAVMQGVNLIQTKLRTTAENLHTAAQGKGTIATAALTAAQWAFNAAANANPIGIVIVAIVACIAAVYGLVKAFNVFFGTSDEAIKAYDSQKQALDELCDSNDKLIERMKARGATEADLLNQTLQNKQAEKDAAEALFARACDIYDEDEDEYKDALEAKKKADEDFESSKEDGLNYLLKIQSDVNAYERENAIGTLAYKIEIIEAEKKKQLELAQTLYKNGEMTRQMYEDIVAAVNKSAQIKIDKAKAAEAPKVARRSSGGSGISNVKNAADELKKAVQAGEDALVKIIEDSIERQRQAELLSYSRKLKELQAHLAKTKETQVEMRKAINNQIEGLTAEHDRKMEELMISRMERTNKTEADFINSRLTALEAGSDEELQWKLKSLDNQYQAELIALQKSENDKTFTAEQAEQLRADLAVKYARLKEDAEEEHADNMADLIEKQYADEQSIRDNDYMLALYRLKQRYSEELSAAKGNSAKEAKIKEKFERDQAELSEKYAIDTAQKSIDMIEAVLKTEGLSAEERQKNEEELAKAKIALETAVADATIAQEERKRNADRKTKEERIANAEKWLQVASDALNAINDLTSTVYDAKIQKVEEEQEANNAAGEAEQERISSLVEKNVITEEEGEARKRAAADMTAKKDEELARKKAKIKEKQAVFDKLNSLAQTGIATALSLMKLWVEPGWPAAIPMMAVVGALGAMQMATILATPLPKYAKGTDSHPGGPAIVGDGGRHELVLFDNSAWITPDRPTLCEIPAGAAVIPDIITYGNIAGPVLDMPSGLVERPTPKPYDDTEIRRGLSEVRRGVSEVANLLRAQIKQQHADAYDAQYELFKSKI